MDSHKRLTAASRDTASVEREHEILTSVRTTREVSMVAKLHGPILDPAWKVEDLDLEDIVLAYLGRRTAPASQLVGLS